MHVSTEQFVSTLREVVAEKGPNYVYTRRMLTGGYGFGGAALYAWEGAPDCIIGCVLHKLGVPIFTLGQLGTRSFSAAATSLNVKLPDGFTVDPLAYRLMKEAQWGNDHHQSWGFILKTVENIYAAETKDPYSEDTTFTEITASLKYELPPYLMVPPSMKWYESSYSAISVEPVMAMAGVS